MQDSSLQSPGYESSVLTNTPWGQMNFGTKFTNRNYTLKSKDFTETSLTAWYSALWTGKRTVSIKRPGLIFFNKSLSNDISVAQNLTSLARFCVFAENVRKSGRVSKIFIFWPTEMCNTSKKSSEFFLK